jgi:ATP:ADP antiporter, AAA family
MAALLRRLVDLREGESISLLQAFVVLFGLIAGHTILETARDALFLDKLPASSLAFVYALLAGLAYVSSAWNARFVARFGRRNALIFTLLVAAYGTTLLHFQPQTKAVVFMLYLWSGLLGTVMVIQFWMFAGQLFTLAQGKRLFGPIASGGVLGAVAGASAAMVALEFASVESLLLIASAIFIITAILLTGIGTDEVRATVTLPAAQKAVGLRGLFREHPYLVRITALVALSTATVLATDYLFKSVAAEYAQGKDLGSFFARYYAVLNAVSLIVQVAIAGRIIRRQGVTFSVLILPTLLLLGASGVLAAGGLLAIVLLTKGADGALRHSLHRVSTELLWMPVPPEARDRAKALIDGVIARVTQAVTAAVLFVMALIGLGSPRMIAAFVLLLALGWLFAGIGLRRPYLDLFRQALRKGTLEDTTFVEELDLNSVEAVLESLSSREPDRVIAAMELLEDKKRSRLIPGLILYHESDDVLVRALELLSRHEREDWLPLAERLTTHASERVRAAAVRAFATKGRVEHLEKVLDDPSAAVRAHAAFCLAHCDTTKNPREDARIRDLFALEGEAGRSARIALLDAIRDHADVRWADLVMAMLESDDAEVVEHAAQTMAELKDERFIPMLISRLKTRDGRGAIRSALVELGPPALAALEKILLDQEADPHIRLHVPRTISRFGTQHAADLLLQQLTKEPNAQVRYKILRGLGRMVAEYDVRIDRAKLDPEIKRNLVEHLRLLSLLVPLQRGAEKLAGTAKDSGALLMGLLEDKSKAALERAFRLLQIAHKHEDIRSIYLALSSNDKRTRANAQEFLDVLTTVQPSASSADQMRELWRLVGDDLPIEDRVTRAAFAIPAPPVEYANAVSILVRENDEYVASLAAYHALETGVEELLGQVMEVYEERPSLRVILSRATSIPLRRLEAASG